MASGCGARGAMVGRLHKRLITGQTPGPEPRPQGRLVPDLPTVAVGIGTDLAQDRPFRLGAVDMDAVSALTAGQLPGVPKKLRLRLALSSDASSPLTDVASCQSSQAMDSPGVEPRVRNSSCARGIDGPRQCSGPLAARSPHRYIVAPGDVRGSTSPSRTARPVWQ